MSSLTAYTELREQIRKELIQEMGISPKPAAPTQQSEADRKQILEYKARIIARHNRKFENQ